MSLRLTTFVVIAYFAFTAATATAASIATLHKREARQMRVLHRYQGTLRFFAHHRREARSRIGRREIHRARIWIGVLRRELRETRVALRPKPVVVGWLVNDFICIHRYEGAWNANTGNGYYGGLQMDLPFQKAYGSEYLRRWGTADKWPVWAQVSAAVRAYKSGRGFYPWPNTARYCGLI